jgi:uncharacterized lipoprotein YajG
MRRNISLLVLSLLAAGFLITGCSQTPESSAVPDAPKKSGAAAATPAGGGKKNLSGPMMPPP